MDQISKHINYTNKKTHSYDKMRKMIVNLVSKKGDNNDNSYPQLSRLHNSLLMIIVEYNEIDLSHGEWTTDTMKLHTYYVKLSSILFSCSICEMYSQTWYNNHVQKMTIGSRRLLLVGTNFLVR